MNLFDHLQDSAFDVVTNTMGYDASWQPVDDENGWVAPMRAKVLYKGPSEKEKIQNADYDPDKLTLEYKQGDFPGLKAAADNNTGGVITIAEMFDGSTVEFSVRSCRKLFDGNTYEVRLELR